MASANFTAWFYCSARLLIFRGWIGFLPLVFRPTPTAEIDQISMDHGVLDITASTFAANRHRIEYPVTGSRLIPKGKPHWC
jgi:hypothetical protein